MFFFSFITWTVWFLCLFIFVLVGGLLPSTFLFFFLQSAAFTLVHHYHFIFFQSSIHYSLLWALSRWPFHAFPCVELYPRWMSISSNLLTQSVDWARSRSMNSGCHFSALQIWTLAKIFIRRVLFRYMYTENVHNCNCLALLRTLYFNYHCLRYILVDICGFSFFFLPFLFLFFFWFVYFVFSHF